MMSALAGASLVNQSPLRRSLLYVPGSAESMIRKVGSRGADVVILDLEDGVHPEQKAGARQQVARLYREVDFAGAEVLVRANPLGGEWGAGDLAMLAELRPAGVVSPKSEDPAEVERVDRALGRSLPLFLMVETAQGVLAAPSLARSSPRVAGLIFGAADFRESVRATAGPDELELHFARSQLVLAARAAEVEVFDTPWFDYRDSAGLAESAARARRLGFDGKSAIHPAQVAVINQVFSPSGPEIERARRIVEVMEAALGEGRHLASLEGELIEALHLRGARRILAVARRLGLAR
jgi:citrate lyase subunit beta/citryl-CoA lyase